MPDAASVETAEKLVRDVFGDEHSQARSISDKMALAKKMLTAAMESTNAPAEQFVLFRVARDIAASAADAETALKAAKGIGQRFRVDSLEMQVAVLEKISGKARLPSDHKSLLLHFGAVFDEAIASERFDVARQVHKLATASAVKTRDVAARRKAAARLKELDRLEKEFAYVKQALAVLDQHPTDPEANLTVGKYRCFIKGGWEAGLPMLALGNDGVLAALARRELDPPTDPPKKAALADDWWDQAQAAEGRTKNAMLLRARGWYEAAVPKLTGLDKAKAQKRLQEIARPKALGSSGEIRPGGQLPRAQWIDLLDWVDTSRDTVTGKWSKDGKELKATTPVKGARLMLPVNLNGSYELAVEFTRTAGDRDMALVLPVGSQQCLAVLNGWNNQTRIHGIGWIDGRSEKDNQTTVRPGTLVNGRRYLLLVQVKAEGDMAAVAVFLNGAPITAWSGRQTSLSVPSNYATRDPSRPGLVAWLAEGIFHGARLRVVDGEATRTMRPNPP